MKAKIFFVLIFFNFKLVAMESKIVSSEQTQSDLSVANFRAIFSTEFSMYSRVNTGEEISIDGMIHHPNMIQSQVMSQGIFDFDKEPESSPSDKAANLIDNFDDLLKNETIRPLLSENMVQTIELAKKLIAEKNSDK